MAELFDEVVAFVARRELLDAQARELGVDSRAQVGDAAVLSAAVSIAGFAHWAATPPGEAWLRTQLATVQPTSLDAIPEMSAHRDYHRLGVSVMARLLGDRRDEIVDRVASQSGLRHDIVAAILATTVWATVVHIARQQTRSSAVDDLSTRLANEQADLIDAGWGPWIDLLDGKQVGPLPANGSSSPPADAVDPVRPAGSAAVGSDPGPATTAMPRSAADRRPSRSEGGGRADPIDAGALPGRATQRPMRSPSRPRWHAPTLGLLLLGLIAAAVWALLLRDGDRSKGGDAEATATTAATVQTGGGEASTTATTAAVATTTEVTATTDEADRPVPDLAEYSVELVDPQGRSDAAGTLDLRLDTVTGEACYAYDVVGVDPPFASHLHVGPSATSGGITIDFGLLEPTSSGCVDSEPADLIAAVSSASQRYVEIHDPAGAFGIRAQLTEPEAGESLAAPDPSEDAGAYTAIAGSQVELRGEVPDQESMDALIASVDDLARQSIGVVNQLVVNPDAPPPSDRIVIEDTVLFDVDSVELAADDLAVLADIASIVALRPSWSIVVVGNTDSSGSVLYNFSLSLRRSQAVRRALVEFGAPSLSVRIQGDGPTNPVGANETVGGRAENRRIELRVEIAG